MQQTGTARTCASCMHELSVHKSRMSFWQTAVGRLQPVFSSYSMLLPVSVSISPCINIKIKLSRMWFFYGFVPLQREADDAYGSGCCRSQTGSFILRMPSA
jgi:hypothetical protein